MKAIKLIAYILLSVCLLFSGKAFLTDFNRVTEKSNAIAAARSMDDIDHSGYANAVIVSLDIVSSFLLKTLTSPVLNGLTVSTP